MSCNEVVFGVAYELFYNEIMSIIIKLPNLCPKFFSCFYNNIAKCVESNFQEENNVVYFLTFNGLIRLYNEHLILYKFKKPVNNFAKLLLSKNYIICNLEKKIVVIDKNDPKKHIHTYRNKTPLIGQPCYMGESVYFIDSTSLKKLCLTDFKITELYRFKIEGKISLEMSEIIKYGEYIVFFNRTDSLIFMNEDGIIEKKFKFPITNKRISQKTFNSLKKDSKKFFELENGESKFKMTFLLESPPILYRRFLFLKYKKWLMRIDNKLNVKFLRSKQNCSLLVPN